MSAVYDEIEIEDMTWDSEKLTFSYPCPCGDKFLITLVRTGTLCAGISNPRNSNSWSSAHFVEADADDAFHCCTCRRTFKEVKMLLHVPLVR